jgi:hypothetical protein
MPAEPRKVGEEHDDRDTLARRILDLEVALAASRAGAPVTANPYNGAGEGTEVAETWSLGDQQKANKTP